MSINIKQRTRLPALTGVWTYDEVDIKRDKTPPARLRPSDFDVAEFYCGDAVPEASAAARPESRGKRRAQLGDMAARLTPELVAPIKTVIPAIRRWRQRRRNAAILYALDDAILKDIGISRCSIEHIVRAQGAGEA